MAEIQGRFLMALACVLLLFLPACTLERPVVIDLPKDIDAVATPFITALQKGDLLKAAKHVAPTARDELDALFAAQHRQLKPLEPLTPRFMTYKPRALLGPDDSEVTLVYAAKTRGKWTTMEVRLFRLNDEPYEVDYWKIGNAAPAPKSYIPVVRPPAKIIAGVSAVLAVLGLLFIGAIVWLVRRKPAMLSPSGGVETRRSAVAVRDGDDGL